MEAFHFSVRLPRQTSRAFCAILGCADVEQNRRQEYKLNAADQESRRPAPSADPRKTIATP
jgi:hypothetical protein